MCALLVGCFGLMTKAWAQLPLPAGRPEGLRARRSELEQGLPEKSRREQPAWDTCVRTLPPRPSVKGVGAAGVEKVTEARTRTWSGRKARDRPGEVKERDKGRGQKDRGAEGCGEGPEEVQGQGDWD